MEIVGLVGGVVGVVGIIYTIYYGRRGQKKKLMVYEVSKSIPLAQAFSPEGDYKLFVLFQRKGSIEEKIESVYTTFLKFANLGKESIRGGDIAPANPLKVAIEGVRILDIQLAGTTRGVNNVSLSNQVMENEQASAYVNFDFLDHRDGALIKILSVGNKGKISLEGDIIGMPEGINNIDQVRPSLVRSRNMFKRAWMISLFVAGSILAGFICYWATGNPRNIWLMFLPWGVYIVLAIIFVMFDEIRVWLRGGLSFPRSLDLPRWVRPFGYPLEMVRLEMMRSALSGMEIQEAAAPRNEVTRKEIKGGEDR